MNYELENWIGKNALGLAITIAGILRRNCSDASQVEEDLRTIFTAIKDWRERKEKQETPKRNGRRITID